MQVGLRHLNANVQHPDVIERQLAVVSAEDVKLSLDDVGSVPTARSGPEVARLHLLPHVLLDVKHVNIVHPVGAVVPSEVVNLRVDEAAGGGDACARLVARDERLHPCECTRVQVEDIVQLSVLVRLTPKDVDLLLKGDC